MTNPAPLVRIHQLHVELPTREGPALAVRGLDLEIPRGAIVGLVGESGCGKSVTARAILRLLPRNARTQGTVNFDGKNILDLPEQSLQGYRGRRVSMVFQNPMDALNPVFTLRQQLYQVFKAHRLGNTRQEWEERAQALVTDVGLPDPPRTLSSYPHQLSGGMQQRAMIAYALASEPDLLIADEPTTALDVTIQKQVLDLISDLRERKGLTVLFITHDLGVLAQVCDHVAVLYLGRTVETGPVRSVLTDAKHPYTRALVAALPQTAKHGERLTSIKGTVPSATTMVPGCAFAPRCPYAIDKCLVAVPPLIDAGRNRTAACVRLGDIDWQRSSASNSGDSA